MLAFFEKHGIIYMLSAGVAEWQTHVTQNHAERSVPVRVATGINKVFMSSFTYEHFFYYI